MDAVQRIAIAIDRIELDGEREGMNRFLLGQIDGLKQALAILVGEKQAVFALRHRSGVSASLSRQEIGRRIAQARRDRGLTQKQLAELTGVKERSVQAWEQGETNPYRRMRALERVLELPGSWLLRGASVSLPPPLP